MRLFFACLALIICNSSAFAGVVTKTVTSSSCHIHFEDRIDDYWFLSTVDLGFSDTFKIEVFEYICKKSKGMDVSFIPKKRDSYGSGMLETIRPYYFRIGLHWGKCTADLDYGEVLNEEGKIEAVVSEPKCDIEQKDDEWFDWIVEKKNVSAVGFSYLVNCGDGDEITIEYVPNRKPNVYRADNTVGEDIDDVAMGECHIVQ